MRKLLVALQIAVVLGFAVALSNLGTARAFDPQPDPPSAYGWVNPGVIRGFNPQPEPPGSYVMLNPQPLPPRISFKFGALMGDGSV